MNAVCIIFAVISSAVFANAVQTFECFQCTGTTNDCQNQRKYEQCPPNDAPADLSGNYRCMLAINKIDNTVFQGCVSACKEDSNQFYQRTCSTTSRGNCLSGTQCTQAGPGVIAASSFIRPSVVVLFIGVLLFVTAFLR